MLLLGVHAHNAKHTARSQPNSILHPKLDVVDRLVEPRHPVVDTSEGLPTIVQQLRPTLFESVDLGEGVGVLV